LHPYFNILWRHINAHYPTIADEHFGYSTEKGIIAYSHTFVASMRFKTNLSKEKYKSDLDLTDNFYEETKNNNVEQYNHLNEYRNKQSKTLDNDYKHSNEIYAILKKQFGDKMMYKHYFMFYLKLDLCLLADFFESFRNTLIPTHKLDTV
jgi:hypothetical protein